MSLFNVYLVWLLSFLVTMPTRLDKMWIITEESSLEIFISTNVKDFHCELKGYSGDEVLYERLDIVSGMFQLSGKLEVASADFDCHNRFMTSDFAKTLKADDYPLIAIRFIDLLPMTNRDNPDVLQGSAEITLAGVTNVYKIRCTSSDNGTTKHLNGSQALRLSDFGLVPPKKLFGALTVSDSVWVEFHLKLKSI